MNTNIISDSLFVSFIFAYSSFLQQHFVVCVISVELFTELFVDVGKSLHCITLHCESLFVPFHLLSSPFLIRKREIRCERDSNHCELLEVASKASFRSIILVAPEGRGQNTHSHVILQQNCSYHLIVVLCWLCHSMDLLGEVQDE
jgi:hypothetical protein